MKKLYLDCDGVILDTINKSYEMIKDKDLKSEEDIRSFYRNLDWGELIILSGEIDDSISKIKKLSEFFDVEILTHVNSENESIVKINYFEEKLPGINVITVPKTIHKCDIVNPNGAILVDDFIPNLELWEEKGGISIKFSDSGKECDFITISDLLELLNINFDNKMKIKE